MLTKPTTLASQAKSIIVGYDSIDFVTVLGGTAAVTEEVLLEAEKLIK